MMSVSIGRGHFGGRTAGDGVADAEEGVVAAIAAVGGNDEVVFAEAVGRPFRRFSYMNRRAIWLKMSCQRIGQRRFGRSGSSGSWMKEGSSGRKSSPVSLSSSSIVTM